MTKSEAITRPEAAQDTKTSIPNDDIPPLSSITPAETLSSAKVRKTEIENKTTTIRARTRADDENENKFIKHLRDHGKKQWHEIATQLNHRRKELGLPEDMSRTAVYSRYIRSTNVKRKAAIEVGLNVPDIMHLRPPKYQVEPTLAVGTAPGSAPKKALKSRRAAPRVPKVLAFPEIQGLTTVERSQLSVNTRKRVRFNDAETELAIPALSQAVVEAVGVVKRNFWIYVADELERLSGKLYESRAVERRYNKI